MEIRLLVSFVLLTYNTGFSAEISVFVQTGESVQLDLQTQDLPAEFDDLSWINEKQVNIVKFMSAKATRPHPSYKDRVDFNNQSFSLTLKNMQKNDSGLYTAKTSGLENKDIVTYRVSVIDAVKVPVLEVNSNVSSPALCSFTCTGGNITISFTYHNSSCSQDTVQLPQSDTLNLKCSSDIITCNYSNPVSWKNETKKVNELCTGNPEYEKFERAFPLPPWVVPFICLLAVVILSVPITSLYIIWKRKKGDKKPESVYSEVDDNAKPQKSLETKKIETLYDTAKKEIDMVTIETIATIPNNDPMNQSESPTEESKPAGLTIYCTIEKQPDTSNSDGEHTIYAKVNKPPPKSESTHPE